MSLYGIWNVYDEGKYRLGCSKSNTKIPKLKSISTQLDLKWNLVPWHHVGGK